VNDARKRENKMELKNSIGAEKRCFINEVDDNNFFYKKIIKRKISIKKINL